MDIIHSVHRRRPFIAEMYLNTLYILIKDLHLYKKRNHSLNGMVS